MQNKEDIQEEIQSGKNVGFKRIGRVTGYLTGDTKMMNNAKQAEVAERVKHVSVKS